MATKLYLRSTAATNSGTLPGGSALGGTPTVTAAGASTNLTLDTNKSASAQTSTTITTDGTANAQTAWFTRHLSAPLKAQTIAAQVITYSGAASEANAGSNFNPTIWLGVWDPVGNTTRGTLLTVGTITVAEPGTTQTAGSSTGSSTQVIASAGDIVVCEVWRKSVAPGQTTARTNIVFWDGTTEASTTNEAAFISFANNVNFQYVSAPTGISSFVGAVARSTARALAGTQGFVGNAARRTARALTGALATAGTVARSTARALTASQGFVGAASRTTSRATAATQDFAGAIARVTARALSGALSFTGSLATELIHSGTNYLQSVAGVLDLAGTLARAATRTLSGAVDFAGSLATQRVLPSLRAIFTSQDDNYTG